MRSLPVVLITALTGVSVSSSHAQAPVRCNPSDLYTVSIVYGFDQTLDQDVSTFLVPMVEERNTLERRQAMVDFYESEYGLLFDPTEAGPQFTAGGEAVLSALRVNPDLRYRVYAVDDQNDRARRSRMPITNARLEDDVYLLVVLPGQSLTVRGNFGGPSGVVLSENTQLAFGEYQLLAEDRRGREIRVTTIRYRSLLPLRSSPFGSQPLTCAVSSDRWGEGVALGGGIVTPLPDGFHVTSRNMITFPGSLEASDEPARARCRQLRPEPLLPDYERPLP